MHKKNIEKNINNPQLNDFTIMLQLNCKDCVWLESECSVNGVSLCSRPIKVNGMVRCVGFLDKTTN